MGECASLEEQQARESPAALVYVVPGASIHFAGV